MAEVWKDVKGYEGLYQISNLGRVRSLDKYMTVHINNNEKVYKKGKILTPTIFTSGYKYITLCDNGKTKKVTIHRLVAEAFIPNPDNLPFINHKDENKINNNVENLEWCTAKYNSNYGTAIQRSAEKRSKILLEYNPRSKEVMCIETGVIYKSTREVTRQTGIDHQSISKCCLGKRITAGSYHWKYIEKGV